MVFLLLAKTLGLKELDSSLNSSRVSHSDPKRPSTANDRCDAISSLRGTIWRRWEPEGISSIPGSAVRHWKKVHEVALRLGVPADPSTDYPSTGALVERRFQVPQESDHGSANAGEVHPLTHCEVASGLERQTIISAWCEGNNAEVTWSVSAQSVVQKKAKNKTKTKKKSNQNERIEEKEVSCNQ